ncbi:hypothetical protein IEO21_06539 [Rhodonia placenta]|uniref:Uncharacterized protein n=1 Tax=Rhodonia placenta TaxID=104341 RepID=A0A8H7U166_9APHY|nr:hypothetical protein IEO21_06539 [Postia placenta]
MPYSVCTSASLRTIGGGIASLSPRGPYTGNQISRLPALRMQGGAHVRNSVHRQSRCAYHPRVLDDGAQVSSSRRCGQADRARRDQTGGRSCRVNETPSRTPLE